MTEAKSSRLKPTLSKGLPQGEMGHGGDPLLVCTLGFEEAESLCVA